MNVKLYKLNIQKTLQSAYMVRYFCIDSSFYFRLFGHEIEEMFCLVEPANAINTAFLLQTIEK